MKPIMAAFISLAGETLTDFEKAYLDRYNPAGVVLFKRNIRDKMQLRALTTAIREAVGRTNILIATDQEGGRVCRLTRPEWRTYAAQRTLGALPWDKAAKACHLHAALMARDLKYAGLNMDLAPVLDCCTPFTAPVLKSRCLSDDTDTITRLGKILLQTFIKAGVCPCVKHLPGHGRVTTDPHLHLPVLKATFKEIESDFYPFAALAPQSPVGMTAHIVLPEWDDKPATQSPRVITDIIRGRIGFNGLLISDALDMQALKGTLTERATGALNAGCDCVCYAFGEQSGLEELAHVVPPLNIKGLERLSIACHSAEKPFDETLIPQNADSQYDALIADAPVLADDYDAVETLHQMKGI